MSELFSLMSCMGKFNVYLRYIVPKKIKQLHSFVYCATIDKLSSVLPRERGLTLNFNEFPSDGGGRTDVLKATLLILIPQDGALR